MAQPIYIVQTREPGEKEFKTVAMGKGRHAHYYGKYMECKRAGMNTRFVTVSPFNDKRYRKIECGQTVWEPNNNNHTQTKTNK